MTRKNLTSDDIIQTSITLFGEKGVDNVSMNDIADACGIKKPSLYSHFRSRDDIVSSCYRHGLKIYYERLDAISSESIPFVEKIKRMVFAILELHDEDPYLFRFLVINQYTQIRFESVISNFNIIEFLSSLIDNAIQSKELPDPDQDKDVLALAITGIIIQQSVGVMFGRLNNKLTNYKYEIWNLCQKIMV